MNLDRSPAIFVSHGAPVELINKGPWQIAMESVGREISPRAVVVMSAHYKSPAGFDVGYCPAFETIHDFSGFPDELNQFTYPAKGDSDLAQQCVDLLHGASIPSSKNQSRGLDHGSYVPLFHMWPKAKVPVVPVAIHSKASPQDIFRAGEILAPLRHEGVMILGSGGMVHNLGQLVWDKPSLSAPQDWAIQFQSWVLNCLRTNDFDALCNFKSQSPDAKVAHPTWEHFAPLIFIAGAASAWGESVTELYSGWTYGTLSMESIFYGKIFRDS